MVLKIITVFCSVSFLYYGVICLFSREMVVEFKRFGLDPWQRKITGILQLFGGAGLLLGLKFPFFGLIASAGLALLMLLGFITRMKIQDGLIKSLPAIIYALLNIYLVYAYYPLL